MYFFISVEGSNPLVLLLGHEVGVGPLVVEELQIVLLLVGEGRFWSLLPLAPGALRPDEEAARGGHGK